MAQVSFTQGKSTFARQFTFLGKRRPLPTPAWLSNAAAILILLALSAPAAGQPQMGPTSSASVSISLSVSARYELRASDAAIHNFENGDTGFCVTTNGQPMDLPVRLVRHAADGAMAGQLLNEEAVQLHWCAGESWAIDPLRRGGPGEAAPLMIVHPE